MWKSKSRICCLAFSIVLILPGLTFAHKPLNTSVAATRTNPVVVGDHQISTVAYTELTQPKEVDYYRFTAKAGEEIIGTMLIPKLNRLRNFNPSFALIGPGLSLGTDKTSSANVLDIKPDEGVIIADYQGTKPEVFFEPFTLTRYWKKQELRVKAPATGTFYFAVFDTTNQSGKYVFSIGEKENWTVRDILMLPVIWWKTRIFMEEKISTYIIAAVLVMLVVSISYRVIRHIRK